MYQTSVSYNKRYSRLLWNISIINKRPWHIKFREKTIYHFTCLSVKLFIFHVDTFHFDNHTNIKYNLKRHKYCQPLVECENTKIYRWMNSWWNRKWNWALWMDSNCYIMGIGHGDVAFFFMCLFQGKTHISKVFPALKGIKYPFELFWWLT